MKTPPLFRHVQAAVREVKIACGVDLRKRVADRTVLEETIFPFFIADVECVRILFVGCAWYTLVYNKMFCDKEWWTIESDEKESRFGSPGRHVVDSVQNVERHFAPNYFDVIICNGVFGWGLNSRDDVEQAAVGMSACTRAGGVLLIGYNDIPSRCPFPIASESPALSRLTPFLFPPVDASTYAVPNSHNNHTYLFYKK